MYYYGNLPYYKNSQELTHEAYFSLKELFHRFSHLDLNGQILFLAFIEKETGTYIS